MQIIRNIFQIKINLACNLKEQDILNHICPNFLPFKHIFNNHLYNINVKTAITIPGNLILIQSVWCKSSDNKSHIV